MSNLTLSRVLSIAIAEKGYRETPVNHTKYGKWYPMDGQAWCAMFISWCFRENLNLIGGKFARTDTKARALADRGLFHRGTTGLRKGDIVFFNFGQTGGGRYLGIHHVGLCLGPLADGRFSVLEGNTDDMVKVRYRSPSSIAGYFRPKYYVAPKPPAPKPPAPKPTPTPVAHPTLKEGSTGAAVKTLQNALVKKGYIVRVDGDFGPKTEAAVKAFQKAHRLPVDGIVGPKTWAALLAAAPAYKTGTVIATSGLRVRKGPGTNYAILGKLGYRAKVKIVSSAHGWDKIVYGSGYGYVATQYVQ